MNYLRFLGKSEGELIKYCDEHGLTYRMVVTKDPRAKANEQTEKRVIRVREYNQTLEILVGCFTLIPQQT